MEGTINRHGSDARKGIQRGINKVSKMVGVTMGPKGRNVLLDLGNNLPHITKDGVTVAEHINMTDREERVGAEMIKLVARNTVYQAGDGTSSASILTNAIVNGGIDAVNAGHNPMEINEGIKLAAQHVVDNVRKDSKRIGPTKHEEIKNIATISANNDTELGKLIAQAIEQVGVDGMISVERSHDGGTTVDSVTGMKYTPPYGINSNFIADPYKGKTELVNPLIVVTTDEIRQNQQLKTIINTSQATGRPVLVFTGAFEGEALGSCAQNFRNGRLTIIPIIVPVKAHMGEDFLEDVAAFTGAEVIKEDKGMSVDTAQDIYLGGCARAVLTPEGFTLIGPGGEEKTIKERVKHLKNQEVKADNQADKKMYRERIARLTGGVAVLSVGGNTALEIKERMDRADDSLNATRSALQEGVLPGGGSYLYRLSINMEPSDNLSGDEMVGYEVLLSALKAPLDQIIKNTGKKVDESDLAKHINKGLGYDARNDKFVNMFEAGIIDPAKVARCAIEAASSAAGIILTIEGAIIQDVEVQP